MIKVKADLHIHTTHSDGKLSIPEVVDLYGRAGFGVIAITDHLVEHRSVLGRIAQNLNYSVSPRAFQKYCDEVRFEAERAWRQYQMRVLFGYEISKNSFVNQRSAHILIIGTDNWIDPHLSVDEILQEARIHQALTIAAHPFPTNEFEFQTLHLWDNRSRISKWVDAWEASYRDRLVPEVLHSGLPVMASSDFHHLKHARAWRTTLQIDLGTEISQDSIFRTIREQRLEFYLEESLFPQNQVTFRKKDNLIHAVS